MDSINYDKSATLDNRPCYDYSTDPANNGN